jgi:uncharacterized protein (TIGR02284 family)
MSSINSKSLQQIVSPLIETCHDGEAGFNAAAEVINDESLKREFLQYSRVRAGFAAALASTLQKMGHSTDGDGSIAAAIHRGWIKLTALRPGDNEHAVLAACESGEDSAVEAYTEAMQSHLPGVFSELISNQYKVVKTTYDRIRALRDAAK